MSDLIAARVRTWWPWLLGWLAAALLTWAAPVVSWLAGIGMTVTETQVEMALGAVLGGLLWEVGRWLERQTGAGRLARVARTVGRLLLSLGVHTGQPAYQRQANR